MIEEIWRELVPRLRTVLMLVSNQSHVQVTVWVETMFKQRAAKIAKVTKVLVVICLLKIDG